MLFSLLPPTRGLDLLEDKISASLAPRSVWKSVYYKTITKCKCYPLEIIGASCPLSTFDDMDGRGLE